MGNLTDKQKKALNNWPRTDPGMQVSFPYANRGNSGWGDLIDSLVANSHEHGGMYIYGDTISNGRAGIIIDDHLTVNYDLRLQGAILHNLVVVDSDYNATIDDCIIAVNTNTIPVTIVLPSDFSRQGQMYQIINTGVVGNDVMIDTKAIADQIFGSPVPQVLSDAEQLILHRVGNGYW